MQGRQDIQKDDGKAGLRGMTPAPGKKKMIYLCRGEGISFNCPNTGGQFKELLPDGTERAHIIRPKEVSFHHGWYETEDPDIIANITKQPGFGIDFYYHPNFCPPDGDVERAKRFMPGKPGMIDPEGHVRRIDNAKYFDPQAHPVDGVKDPVDPETGEPDPAGAWPTP